MKEEGECLHHFLVTLQRVVLLVLQHVLFHLLHLLLKMWGNVVIHIREHLLWVRLLPWFGLGKRLHHLPK